MQRFYINLPLGEKLYISDKEMMHQMIHVLRMKKGDKIGLFNGDRSETIYDITSFSKESIELWAGEKIYPHTEAEKEITLYQALPNKYEKIEYIIEKGIEIGIRRFVFFRSDRSQKLILSAGKIKRFESIAKEALEQCGGVIFPEIYFTNQYDVQYIHGPCYVLHTVKPEYKHNKKMENALTLFVGPEGGWSSAEVTRMLGNGFIFVYLGERILRTETAGLVGVCAILHESI